MARSNNDKAHLRRLRDLYAREHCLPSYGQMAKALGFQAKNAAYKLANRLMATGHVVKAVGGRLSPGPNFFDLDLSEDEIRASFGADSAGSGFVHDQALHQLLVQRPSRTILVPVRGESMVDAGILNGDIAVLELGVQATQGDFVVAEIDQTYTIKEYRRVDGKPCLVSHGIQSEAVAPRQSLNIIGVVRGIARSYKPRRERPIKRVNQRGTR